MHFFKLPSALRWGLVNCLLIWVMMSVYRIVLISLLYGNVFSHFGVISKGILLDFGAVSIPGFLFILCSFVPGLHPYKRKSGLYFSLIFFSFFGMLYAFIYGLDLVFIKILSTRISGSSIQVAMNSPDTNKAFEKNMPYFTLITGVTLLVWIWWILIYWLYKLLGGIARAEEKIVRHFWQAFCLFVFLVGFIIAAKYTASSTNKDIFLNENFRVALSANPVMTLLFR